MVLRRRRPLIAVEVTLYAPARAAVLLERDPERDPAEELADRLRIGVGLAALVVKDSTEERFRSYKELLQDLAQRLAGAPEGPLPGDLVPLERFGVPEQLAVVPWEGPGPVRVPAEVIGAPGGIVPRLGTTRGATGPTREVAALALLVALGADGDRHGRLALALAIEGMLGWYREATRLSPARNALGFALAHCVARLEQAGYAAPPGLP